MERQKSVDFWIRLDRKARLVLPLEIRESLALKSGEKILLSVSAVGDGKVTMVVAKAGGKDSGVKCSRNCAYKEGV
ncbi:MAG: AbrB/MazE/SpoVT family DNA-binding domain-containing protein [Candidatus Micrarchaeota archaeon]